MQLNQSVSFVRLIRGYERLVGPGAKAGLPVLLGIFPILLRSVAAAPSRNSEAPGARTSPSGDLQAKDSAPMIPKEWTGRAGGGWLGTPADSDGQRENACALSLVQQGWGHVIRMPGLLHTFREREPACPADESVLTIVCGGCPEYERALCLV